ncbi:MAG TPA: NAD-dependent epimerase/dehydratase family protein [Bacteroidia bacterium]|nr:NAD-dependent epimerase/dehydratase family protein [Bacteroidia bacterium]
MNVRKTLLITGGTGFIGSHICRKFIEEGWHIVSLVRKIPAVKTDAIDYMLFDLKKPVVPELPSTIDVFIHAAFVRHARPEGIYNANLNSAKMLLDAIAPQNIPVKLFISSLSAKEHAASAYGRSKFDISQLFLASGGSVVRAGLVLGKGGLFLSMWKYISSKKIIPLFGDGLQPVQAVHIDDLVDCIYKITTQQFKGTFVVAENVPVSYKQFYTALAAMAGVNPRFVRLSFGATTTLLKVAEFFGKEMPVTSDNLLGLKEMEYIPSAADLKLLGIQLRDWKTSLAQLNSSID